MTGIVRAGTGRSRNGAPSASSVSVTMPRRATVSYALRAPSRPPAILVASPKHTGSKPVASGSRLPVWPPFSARNRWRTRCRAWLDDRPCGLSSSRMPSSPRKTVRGRRGGAGSVGVVTGADVAQQVVDAFAAIHRLVVVEMQFRHVAHLHRARELVADFRRERLERLDGFRGLLGLQHRHEHLGV